MKQDEREVLIKQANIMNERLQVLLQETIQEPIRNDVAVVMMEIYGELNVVKFKRLADKLHDVKSRVDDDLWSDCFWEVQKFCDALEEIKVTEKSYQVANKSEAVVRKMVRDLTDGKCTYCDAELGDDWHVDHVVPVSQGGPDNLANYVPACPSCNISKNGHHVLTFIKRRLGKQDEEPTTNVVVMGGNQ
jgi:hypothetical protein